MKKLVTVKSIAISILFSAAAAAAPAPFYLSTVLQATNLVITASPTVPLLHYELWATSDLTLPFAATEYVVEAVGTSVSWTIPIEIPAGSQGMNAFMTPNNPASASAVARPLTEQFRIRYEMPQLLPLPPDATAEEYFLRLELIRELTDNVPPLPPTPFTPEKYLPQTTSRVQLQDSPNSPSPEDSMTNAPIARFFRVRQTAPANGLSVTILSPTSGATLQGYAPLQVSASVSVQSPFHVVTAVLWDNDTNKIAYVHSESGLTTVSFQTAMQKLPPGNHRLSVEVIDDSPSLDDGRGNLALSEPITVTLNHPAWFNDTYDTPSLCHPNGTTVAVNAYVLDVSPPFFAPLGWFKLYGPSGAEIGAGSTFSWGDTPFGGFVHRVWYFEDSSGNAIPPPDPYYDVVLNYTPPGFTPADGSGTVIVTNRLFTEVIWPTNAFEACVVYQPLWGNADANNNAAFLKEKLDNVWEKYSTKYLSGPHPEVPGAYPLSTSNRWQEAYNLIGSNKCRALFYFGHGGRDNIGYLGSTNAHLAISSAQLFATLGNGGFAGTGENEQPYRSAIIIGCNAGRTDGNVFEYLLGIPQDDSVKKMDSNWFAGLGVPSRAGVGFTDYKFHAAAYGGTVITPNTELVNGTERLIEAWSAIDAGSGQLSFTLLQSVTISQTDPSGGANKSMRNSLRIIGDKGLKFY